MLRKIRKNRLALFLVVASLIGGAVVFKMAKDHTQYTFLSVATDDAVVAEEEPASSVEEGAGDVDEGEEEEDVDPSEDDNDGEDEDLPEEAIPKSNEDLDEEEEMEEKGILEKARSGHLPTAFILGAEKSGATPLAAFLGLHPDVITVHGKEIDFFGSQENFDKGVNWYKSKLPEVKKGKILIENSPHYYYNRKAPELAKEVYPMDDSVKLIIITRDPVKRLLSEYADMAARAKANGKSVQPFDDAVIDKRALLVNTSYAPVVNGIYAAGLVYWAKYFTRDQTHFVDGDAFITNPISELRKLETFLQIDHKITDDNLYFNSTSGFFCMKTPEGKSRCYLRPPGWQKPVVDKGYFDIIRHFYVHHNDKFFLLSKQRYDWLSN